MRFTQTLEQSTICGPSRMCAYARRYVRSHGSTQNGVPLKVGELSHGDHLQHLGVRMVPVGKTMVADTEGLGRLGIAPDSVIGVRVSECGFEPHERNEGIHPDGSYAPEPVYDHYLRAKGYQAQNPRQHPANSGLAANSGLQNGWLEAFGGGGLSHILEGRSLVPILHCQKSEWRRMVISEYDYAFDLARVKLAVPVPGTRLYMVYDGRFNYIHADGFPPIL